MLYDLPTTWYNKVYQKKGGYHMLAYILHQGIKYYYKGLTTDGSGVVFTKHQNQAVKVTKSTVTKITTLTGSKLYTT